MINSNLPFLHIQEKNNSFLRLIGLLETNMFANTFFFVKKAKKLSLIKCLYARDLRNANEHEQK